jgi:hypothetical protein
MGFWRRVNQNSAAALTVGGTVLALGIALGAVGLAEIGRTKSPWGNVWVRVGCGIGVLALAWILTVFFVAMRATLKRDRFVGRVGRAIAVGKCLLVGITKQNLRAFEELSTDWTQLTASLIEAGLGSADKELFLSSPRLIGQWQTGERAVREHSDRLNRLAELVARPLVVDLSFDHGREWFHAAAP